MPGLVGGTLLGESAGLVGSKRVYYRPRNGMVTECVTK